MKNYEIYNAETNYSLTLNCNAEAAFKFFADVCRLMGYTEVKASQARVSFKLSSLEYNLIFVVFSIIIFLSLFTVIIITYFLFKVNRNIKISWKCTKIENFTFYLQKIIEKFIISAKRRYSFVRAPQKWTNQVFFVNFL